MLRCSVDFIQTVREVALRSGRGFFRRGHYQDCIEQINMKFSVVQLGSDGVDTSIFTGLCLPKQCSDSLITSSIDSALKITGIPLEVLYVDSNGVNYSYPMNWLSYLTLFILIAIIAAVFVSTVRVASKRKQHKWLECFNIGHNMKHFKVRQNKDLNIWDGVRSLAMLWVIIGHCFSFFLDAGVQNITNFEVPSSKPFFLVIEGGLLSVDVFLALGGFFLAYVMLRHRITVKICLLGILQRVLRIWPAYIICMIFYSSLFMHLGSGPYWSRAQADVLGCKTIWRDIIFMSNIIGNGSSFCMGWGWYLQVDFQLFILGVILIFLYSKSKWIFALVSSLLAIGSLAFNYVFTYVEKIRIFTDIQAFINFQDFMENLYIKPYGRCVPYLMGFCLGILFMEYRKQRKSSNGRSQTLLAKVKYWLHQHNIARIMTEWTGIAFMAFVVFIPRPLQLGSKIPQEIHSLYWALSKPLFIGGMILTVLPSMLGVHTSFFSTILTARIFAFIAKISFCTYLVHLMVIYQFIYTRTYDVYYNLTDIFVIYCGFVPIILALGFVTTVFIQLPFGNLFKLGMEKMKEKNNNIVKQSLITKQSLISNQSISQQVKRPDNNGQTF